MVFINYSSGREDAKRLVGEIREQGSVAFPLQVNVGIEVEVKVPVQVLSGMGG